MTNNNKLPSDIFAKNRTEELGYDVWEDFVIPPFFESLSLGNARKPKVIIGGRGCGKTMLLRYLSHDSIFSNKRKSIPNDAKDHIGLYWRADTQFAQLMAKRGIEEDVWYGAFRHLAALSLGIEVLRSVIGIAQSASPLLTNDEIRHADLSRLHSFDPSLPGSVSDLLFDLEDRLAQFESWVNDVRDFPKPRFLPGEAFIARLIKLIEAAFPGLNNAVFFVYIDEYENLSPYQQQIINTWLKHSELPLIFNLAMKRNGFKTRLTTGDESLAHIDDYREIDLEDYDLRTEFPFFAAEILFLKLTLNGYPGAPVEVDVLRDPSKLQVRRNKAYGRRVLEAIQTLLPDANQKELAEAVFRDDVLKSRLTARIEKGLRRRTDETPPKDLTDSSYPEASIVTSCLLFRDSLSTAEIVDELSKLKSGDVNRFTGPTEWIHNNFNGCLLQLYDGLTRPCPFYGGFTTFCYLSRGNLRHFLELCHQSVSRRQDSKDARFGPVTISRQAEAARQVSADFLREIRSFGPEGNNLHTFVLRLGSIFSLSQQRPSQSEPERTHFSVHGGQVPIGDREEQFLAEAIKWSVLFEEKETKKKSAAEPEGVEYVLNPIYAPYFHISYLMRRRLELASDELITLIRGTYGDITALLQRLMGKWGVDIKEAALPLFAHLNEGSDHEN